MTKATETFLCDVAPFAHIPLTREPFFWYVSDVALPPGTLVRVPLFRRHVRGVVLRCRARRDAQTGTVRLKRISAVLHERYFTREQRALALHISATTFTPLGVVLEQFFTPPTAARGGATPLPSAPAPAQCMTRAARALAADILAAQGFAAFLCRDTPHTARDALYATLIRRILARDASAQVLVLLPEILLTEQTAARLGALAGDAAAVAIIHNKRAKGALWRAYEDIAAGRARLIIGTRKALFQPFRALALVIVDEEHDISFKQWDRAPRFDARSVAQTLARMHRCPLLAVSAAPRITRTAPTPLAAPLAAPPITLVDMRQVHFERVKAAKRRKPRATLFSPALLDAVRDALARGKQSLLFFNHKGMSAFSLCTDCGALLACPDCDRALVLTAEGHYECFHCTFTTSIFPRCAHCGGMQFRNVGYGTAKIETMLAKHFPTARIARIDGHTMRATHAAEDLLARSAAGDVDIIIGTQMALKDWRDERLQVVGILDADALLAIPDISADERLFAFISNAAAAVTHGRRHGQVFVQTYTPDYHLFKHAAHLAYDAFRKAVLAERKHLHYPPYTRVVKVIFQHKDAATAAERAATWRTALLQHAPQQGARAWRVSEPHAPLLPRLRGFHRTQIIIRLPQRGRTSAAIPETLAHALSALPPRTIIDIDPVSLV